MYNRVKECIDTTFNLNPNEKGKMMNYHGLKYKIKYSAHIRKHIAMVYYPNATMYSFYAEFDKRIDAVKYLKELLGAV